MLFFSVDPIYIQVWYCSHDTVLAVGSSNAFTLDSLIVLDDAVNICQSVTESCLEDIYLAVVEGDSVI